MALANTLLAATAAFLFAGAAHAGTAQWTLTDAKGDVTVLVAGEARMLPKGAPVPIGAAFVTGRNGNVVLARGDEMVVLAPNSRLRVADPAPTRGIVQMFADEGTATFRMRSSAAPLFAVSTPYLSAAGTSAHFAVSVTADGAQVQALDGAVQVITHDGRSAQRVASGMIGQVSAAQQDRLSVGGAAPRLAVAMKD